MAHPSDKPSLDNLHALFTYHPPTSKQLLDYDAINNAAKDLARAILVHAPDCADRTAALQLVRQARMTANASIACSPPIPTI